MPKQIPAGAVPALQLTPQEEHELRQLAPQLEKEIISQYEDFLIRDQRSVDGAQWKHVKSDGDIHAYKERHVTQRLRRDDSHTPGPQERLAQHSTLPRVLVTGTVVGTLDDVMYGMLFHDTPSLQSFWAVQGDRMEESAVVATLERPYVDDPYGFLGVIWFLRTFPLNLLDRRDFLKVARSGMTQLSNGERVGVSLGQSITHRELSELHEFQTIRAESSVLMIARQLDGNRVEVFMTHFLDTKGMIPEIHHVQVSVVQLVPMLAGICEAGFRKKLEWLVQRRKREDQEALPLADVIEPQSSGTNDHCELCEKRLGTLFSSPGTACLLCYRRVCSRCSLSHELAVQATPTKTVLRAFDFCVHCSLKARDMPTRTVA